MDTEGIIEAIDALKQGKTVVFPTDTVYGLGVAVDYAISPASLYKIKGRDQDKPIAWLVSGVEALDEYGQDVPGQAYRLAEEHWPGALTLVVKASDAVPLEFQSNEGTIGLRMPDSEEALRLVRVVGPLATTSANVSGDADAAEDSQLDPAIAEQAAAVVHGEKPSSGKSSTVVDCTGDALEVLREGEVMIDTTFVVPIEYVSHDQESDICAKLWTNTRFGDADEPGTEQPKAIIQIVHGMAEHIDRYDEFARYLVNRGFIVCGEDHIGHGDSAQSPRLYGHMPVHGGKDVVVGDVHTLHSMMSRVYPDVPYVLYGHSMGSFIARAYIARYGEDLAACVLSGTGFIPANLSKMGNTLARFIASIRGETYRSKFIDNMGAGSYGKKIRNARTPLDWLSTDEAVVDAYIADEKCGFMFTVGGYATLMDLTAEIVTPECAGCVPKDLPVFFVAGDGDPVGDMGAGVKASAKLLRDAGVRTVDEKLYEGMRHEIHNELGREQVYDDIATWIEEHI